MDSEEIERIVQTLDAAVPRDGAHVRIEQMDLGPDKTVVAANRTGYLRLGIEMLKAAFAAEREPTPATLPDGAPGPEGERGEQATETQAKPALASIAVDLDYLLTPDSMVRFTGFERGELEIRDTPAGSLPSHRLLTVGCLILAAIGVFFAVIGFSEVLSWFYDS